MIYSYIEKDRGREKERERGRRREGERERERKRDGKREVERDSGYKIKQNIVLLSLLF